MPLIDIVTRAELAPLEARIAALEAASSPPQEPAKEFRRINTPDELRGWLGNQQEGDAIELGAMSFAFPLDIKANGVTIRAAEGARVKCVAWQRLTASPALTEGVYRFEYTHSLYKHPATQEGPWDGHRDRMCPHQFVVNGKILTPVYNRADLKPGTSYIEGASEKPTAVHVMPVDGLPLESIYYAHYPRLLYSSTGATGVTVEGIEFEGAASTGKRGGVVTGDGWTLLRCKVTFSAATGYELTGEGVHVHDCIGEHNGMLNIYSHGLKHSSLIGFQSKGGNRKRFSAAWIAGGVKIEGSEHLIVTQFYSEDDYGPGLWYDINNRHNTTEDVLVVNSAAAGVMFEHGYYNGIARRITVRDVRAYVVPVQGNTRRDGIVWQSHVWDSEFYDLAASGCDNGGVYKKVARTENTSRGPNGRNLINGLRTEDVRKPLYIEDMPDDWVRAKIARGAKPDDFDLWRDPDTIMNVT